MIIQDRYPLKTLNTFGIPATAEHYAGIESVSELHDFLVNRYEKSDPMLVLGMGSNILFRDDFPGWVVRLLFKGFEIREEETEQILVNVAAGEIWDDVVKYCVDRGWGGIENLSLIPGTAGAAPIQNIGAYGVELSQVTESVRYMSIDDGSEVSLTADECRFGYRESIFKSMLRNRVVITSITLRLSKIPVIRTGYGTIKEELEAMNITEPSIADVRDAVCAIRTRKLPDPAIMGNAGSFFKNPSLPEKQYKKLHERYSDIPSYPSIPGFIKIPAAWLIEQCGWKGKRIGDAGVHEHQPLVLVNHGNASGQEILDLGSRIKRSVWERFGVELTEEVNIIPPMPRSTP